MMLDLSFEELMLVQKALDYMPNMNNIERIHYHTIVTKIFMAVSENA